MRFLGTPEGFSDSTSAGSQKFSGIFGRRRRHTASFVFASPPTRGSFILPHSKIKIKGSVTFSDMI